MNMDERIARLIDRGHVDPGKIAELMAARDAENGRIAADRVGERAAEYQVPATAACVAAGVWIEARA